MLERIKKLFSQVDMTEGTIWKKILLFSIPLILGIFKNLNVQAFDIVEVSPKLDSNDITSWLALKTLYEVFYILK